jgi:hypothetical protein
MARLTPEKVVKAVDLRRKGKSIPEIAKRFGVHRTTVVRALTKYKPNGGCKGDIPSDPLGEVVDTTDINGEMAITVTDRPVKVDELMRLGGLDPEIWVATHTTLNKWENFYKLKSGDGHRKVPLYQTKVAFKRILDDAVVETLKSWAGKYGGKPIPKRQLPRYKAGAYLNDAPQMLTWGIYDAHLGMYAWNQEVETSYDLAIARNRIANSIDDIAAEVNPYRIRKVIQVVGNDFLHCDSTRNQTAFGDHHLDVDSRYAKIVRSGVHLVIYQTERALEIVGPDGEVEIIWVPGNHDYHASYALAIALEQRFRNDPRVKVDLGANPRKFRTFGGVLLGFEHGQKCRPKQVNNIFSTATIELFTKSTYREYHVGHKHQREVEEFWSLIPTNGLVIRTHPALTNVDKWHHDGGLIGEPVKAVEVCRYDETALRGTHIAWARDERNVRANYK